MSTVLLDINETASRLGVSIKTIRRWIYERRHLPVVKVGSKVKFKEKDIEKFIEMNTRAPRN